MANTWLRITFQRHCAQLWCSSALFNCCGCLAFRFKPSQYSKIGFSPPAPTYRVERRALPPRAHEYEEQHSPAQQGGRVGETPQSCWRPSSPMHVAHPPAGQCPRGMAWGSRFGCAYQSNPRKVTRNYAVAPPDRAMGANADSVSSLPWTAPAMSEILARSTRYGDQLVET